MRPRLERNRTKHLMEHLPDVLANIVVEYAGRQLLKREAIIFAKKNRDQKKLEYYQSQDYTDDVDEAVNDFITNYL